MQKQLIETANTASQHTGYTVALARSEEEVREAQRLRYKVFVEELGARIPATVPNHDIDRFDAHCEHLVVRENHADRIVGTYRILTPDVARNIGRRWAGIPDAGRAFPSGAAGRLIAERRMRPPRSWTGRPCFSRPRRSFRR